ncbi:hypothetical protein CAPTEDRAFT_200491 [Capitella teleta]|uniref:Neurotransmitter-gated ion-channel ligand-binding domain-containing protein n=1 Tax=Capitella teleta TaxID=283909 RepID=R7UQR8_CAPTE|nr:hypothetical protein CAPTEDRAFT_200491 [Capitella teleta]|eukprot:ELU06282.1 hypothetical protein CAPTEDRAFT_200491 [Capitella teleta]
MTFLSNVGFLLLVIQMTITNGEKPCDEGSETCLMRFLRRSLKKESIDVRPALNYTNTDRVAFGVSLVGIDSLELIGNTDYKLTTSVWRRYLWTDYRLTWEPTQFGGVDHIRIPIKYLWKPDIVLYNNAELGQQLDEDAMAIASNDGTVMWIPTGKLTVRAKRHVSWLSEDTYTASFSFGSWTYDGFKIDVDFYDNIENLDLIDYSTGDSFEIVENSAVKEVRRYPCCNEPYPALVYSITFKAL